MNSENLVFAIDTSNYTTSVAILDTYGNLVANLKKPLAVKQGERGLRQSDALFAHIQNIPVLMREARAYLDGRQIVAVGVSDKPRNVEGSYMPCFLGGVSAAESIASALGVKLYRFSHQCGHIMAALYSSKAEKLLCEQFAAFHISGGTTELLRVNPVDNGFDTELIGGTLDLNAGQIIDRVGVYMGLKFPAGSEMEALALTNTKKIPTHKICIKDMSVNLSGLENLAVKLYDKTSDKPLVSAFVLDYISRAVFAMSSAYEEAFGKARFVYAGGVMSNSIIKENLKKSFDAYFAEPAMSTDNAVGIAVLTLRAYKSEKGL